MDKPTFVVADGDVHLLSPIGGGEHTLCGLAFDGSPDEADGDTAHRPSTSRTITCSECRAVVVGCRGVRVEASRGE